MVLVRRAEEKTVANTTTPSPLYLHVLSPLLRYIFAVYMYLPCRVVHFCPQKTRSSHFIGA